jgi:hypothetical protein
MSVNFLGFVAAAATLAFIGAANAKDPVRLTGCQLDKVTTGATNTRTLINSAISSTAVTNSAG